MKKIEILGTGCPKCDKLTEAARQAADDLGLDYELEKVTDVNEILKRGVMLTPGLAVDGKVVLTGKTPPAEELAKLFS